MTRHRDRLALPGDGTPRRGGHRLVAGPLGIVIGSVLLAGCASSTAWQGVVASRPSQAPARIGTVVTSGGIALRVVRGRSSRYLRYAQESGDSTGSHASRQTRPAPAGTRYVFISTRVRNR